VRVLLRILGGLAIVILLLAVALVGAIHVRYGGGDNEFPDRTSDPELAGSALEVVADLELPPGNIAVAHTGRIFFTFHPEARPSVQVAELVEGRPIPYPSEEYQPGGSEPLRFQSVLSLRIDRQQRLWALDNANHGVGQPRLLAFDLGSGKLTHHYEFPREIAGLGSHLNDFQVDPLGSRVYIADASIFAKTPALIVYDVAKRTARRLLEGHVSVQAENYAPVVQGRKMLVFGIFAIRPGVDSIALDRRGQWLYYAAVTASKLSRVRTSDLNDSRLSAEELMQRVEAFADKTMSDGITIDLAENVYLSDPEHSAILTLGPDRELRTLFKDPKLRWPDGFSFGRGGDLYVTCSSLHHVIGRMPGHIRKHAPYQIFRFRPAAPGVPGH
jgi:sugar lactone lactonase YvrE